MTDEKEVTAEVTSQDAEFRARAEEAGIPKIVISMYRNALRRLVENEKKAEREACAKVCEDEAEKWEGDDGPISTDQLEAEVKRLTDLVYDAPCAQEREGEGE